MGAQSISQVHGSHSWLVLLLVKLQLYHWPRTFFVNVRSKTSDRALDNPEPKALILQGKLKSHFSYVPGDEARLFCASGCFVSLDMAAVPLLGNVG